MNQCPNCGSSDTHGSFDTSIVPDLHLKCWQCKTVFPIKFIEIAEPRICGELSDGA